MNPHIAKIYDKTGLPPLDASLKQSMAHAIVWHSVDLLEREKSDMDTSKPSGEYLSHGLDRAIQVLKKHFSLPEKKSLSTHHVPDIFFNDIKKEILTTLKDEADLQRIILSCSPALDYTIFAFTKAQALIDKNLNPVLQENKKKMLSM